jgi:hypothetical protein
MQLWAYSQLFCNGTTWTHRRPQRCYETQEYALCTKATATRLLITLNMPQASGVLLTLWQGRPHLLSYHPGLDQKKKTSFHRHVHYTKKQRSRPRRGNMLSPSTWAQCMRLEHVHIRAVLIAPNVVKPCGSYERSIHLTIPVLIFLCSSLRWCSGPEDWYFLIEDLSLW